MHRQSNVRRRLSIHTSTSLENNLSNEYHKMHSGLELLSPINESSKEHYSVGYKCEKINTARLNARLIRYVTALSDAAPSIGGSVTTS